jgi:hypothetical protein
MQGRLRKGRASEDFISMVGKAQDFMRTKLKEVDAHAQMESGKGTGEIKPPTNVPAEPTARGPPEQAGAEGEGGRAGTAVGVRRSGERDTGRPEVSTRSVEPGSRTELTDAEKSETAAATKAVVKLGVRSQP